jgi:hypothetical protein
MDQLMTSERGLSAKAIKWIAMITMAIDHAAASIVYTLYCYRFFEDFPLVKLYQVMRTIGLFSYPLFVYLIVDSFFYTSDRKKFVKGLLIFALISEIPFDIAIILPAWWQGGILDELFSFQNIFFTLTIGTLCLMCSEYVFYGSAAFVSDAEVQKKMKQKSYDAPDHSMGFNLLMVALITAIGCGIAHFLHTDYDIYGILAMVFAYLIHKTGHKKLSIFGIVLALAFNDLSEIYTLLDGFVIYASNGKRGNIQHKWLYYAFYPVHLAIFGCIKLMILHHVGVI